jgi:hypothetical protein
MQRTRILAAMSSHLTNDDKARQAMVKHFIPGIGSQQEPGM